MTTREAFRAAFRAARCTRPGGDMSALAPFPHLIRANAMVAAWRPKNSDPLARGIRIRRHCYVRNPSDRDFHRFILLGDGRYARLPA